MLFQALLNVFAFFVKMAMWIIFGFLAIPCGVLYLSQKIFPIYTQDGGFWYWFIFTIITLIFFKILWKPIVWIIGVVSVLKE